MTQRHTMSGLTNEILAGFSTHQEPPCLSLYQPTHRQHPENQQDPIRFRSLLKELEASLRQKYPTAEAQRLLKPFEALAQDAEFWSHTLDGLAVLGGPGIFRALRIPQQVTEWVAVGESFYTKPLRRFLQSADRYQVLGLSLDEIRLFEGNRHALDELDLVPGVPRSIADARGVKLTEPQLAIASYGGVGGDSNRMQHGQGAKADDADIDVERFFRAVDRAVFEHYSKPSGLLLILAALPEHHHLFRQVSQNPHLVAGGILRYPESLPSDELRALAWQTIEPGYQARMASLLEEFQQAHSKSAGSDDLAQVAEASTSGRVETLLIDGERQVTDPTDPLVGDLLDDLGELVAKNGGMVLVVPAGRMPSRTGLAAIYRY